MHKLIHDPKRLYIAPGDTQTIVITNSSIFAVWGQNVLAWPGIDSGTKVGAVPSNPNQSWKNGHKRLEKRQGQSYHHEGFAECGYHLPHDKHQKINRQGHQTCWKPSANPEKQHQPHEHEQALENEEQQEQHVP